jgi:CubicO group peptidase (beta-lactamase class C family)
MGYLKINLLFLFLIFQLVSTSCGKNDTTNVESMYFPPINSSVWETKDITSLGWNTSKIQELKDFLIQNNTKSFMISVNGRIVMEEYYNGHNASATWEWNSAGKTLVASTVGIAQQENLLNINNKASEYLGSGWTNMPVDKENLITCKNLLSMTSGIDDTKQLIIKSNLNFIADASTRWSYHNVFQKLMDIVSNATKSDFETYFNTKIKNKIGMDGFWNNGLIFKIYNSNTRSMARFGLLALNKGKWENEQILNEAFFVESTSSSQAINPSYGYLWWLNGKNKFMIPTEQTVYQGSLIPNAPSDMYAAMGANDQRIYVIPSKKMVIIRMGEASNPSNPSFAVSGFDSLLWDKINAVIK